MRPMTRLVLGTALLAGIFAAVALGLPSHVTVSRSVVINAPESAIFPYLNNLRRIRGLVAVEGARSAIGRELWRSSERPGRAGHVVEQETFDRHGQHGDQRGPAQPPHRPCREFQRLGRHEFVRRRALGLGSKVIWTFGYDSGTSPLKRWKALMLDGFVGAEYRTGLERLRDKVEADRRPTMPTMVPMPQSVVHSAPDSPPRPFHPARHAARRSCTSRRSAASSRPRGARRRGSRSPALLPRRRRTSLPRRVPRLRRKRSGGSSG